MAAERTPLWQMWAAEFVHEARTPLEVVAGYVRMLERGETGPERRALIVGEMAKSVRRARGLFGMIGTGRTQPVEDLLFNLELAYGDALAVERDGDVTATNPCETFPFILWLLTHGQFITRVPEHRVAVGAFVSSDTGQILVGPEGWREASEWTRTVVNTASLPWWFREVVSELEDSGHVCELFTTPRQWAFSLQWHRWPGDVLQGR
jgi:hypothetical protein